MSDCTMSWYKRAGVHTADREMRIIFVENNYIGCVFYCTWSNPGMYLAVLFYQPAKKLGNISTQLVNKKLSYRRETARQLPTWRGGGLGPPAHSLDAPSGYTSICVWSNSKPTTNVLPSTKRTLRWIGHSRSFKVILIGAGRNAQWSVVVMCN